MADSNAQRQRRKRAHRKGDHLLCSLDRCPDLLANLPSGRVAVVAAKLVEGLGLAEDDPRRLDAEVLLALAPRVERGDTTAARELRRVAAALQLDQASAQLDFVDVLRERRRRRRAAQGWSRLGMGQPGCVAGGVLRYRWPRPPIVIKG